MDCFKIICSSISKGKVFTCLGLNIPMEIVVVVRLQKHCSKIKYFVSRKAIQNLFYDLRS